MASKVLYIYLGLFFLLSACILQSKDDGYTRPYTLNQKYPNSALVDSTIVVILIQDDTLSREVHCNTELITIPVDSLSTCQFYDITFVAGEGINTLTFNVPAVDGDSVVVIHNSYSRGLHIYQGGRSFQNADGYASKGDLPLIDSVNADVIRVVASDTTKGPVSYDVFEKRVFAKLLDSSATDSADWYVNLYASATYFGESIQIDSFKTMVFDSIFKSAQATDYHLSTVTAFGEVSIDAFVAQQFDEGSYTPAFYNANISNPFIAKVNADSVAIYAMSRLAGLEKPLLDSMIRIALGDDSLDVAPYEVTQGQYAAIMGSASNNNLPVTSISFSDIVFYCNKRSLYEGQDTAFVYDSIATDTVGVIHFYLAGSETIAINRASRGYRLPTESEWNNLYLSGHPNNSTTASFYWGSSILPAVVENYANVNYPALRPVGESGNPNLSHLYDLSGNAEEVVLQELDPQGLVLGLRTKGGSHLSDDIPKLGRNYFGEFSHGSKAVDAGFRVVRSVR